MGTNKNCNKTFIELYQEAVNAPTPRQVFLEHISKITGRSEFTVRSWVTGVRQPDILACKAIAEDFGMDWRKLFPDKKVKE